MEYLYKDLTAAIIKCACKVHSSIGPDLFKSAKNNSLKINHRDTLS